MLIGMIVSIWLFSNQTKYVGPIPEAHAGVGDVTFFVGFALSAVAYFVLFQVLKPSLTPPATTAPGTAEPVAS